MTLEPSHPEDPAEQPLLQADGLGIRMAERWLFRNLGFSLSRGDFLAVVGPSGSGKTTLLRSLTGELKSDEGSVRNLAQGLLPCGTIFQDLQLANGARAIQNALSGSLGRHGTLETLFGFPASEKSSSMELLERLGLADKGDQWTSTLSRGERQRLAIARTLLAAPRVLLADEPVASLDQDWANSVLSLLKEKQSQRKGALVCVLHDVEQVERHATHQLTLSEEESDGWSFRKV